MTIPGAIWCGHFVLLSVCWVWLMFTIRQQRHAKHVFFMSTSYLILTGIDAYTIAFENYPADSWKATAMLVAFVLGAVSLTDYLFRKVNRG